MKHSQFAAVVGLAAVALVLAGCTATAPPVASATPVPAPSVTPTPTATPTPAAAPGPRIQIPCAKLYSKEQASKLVEASVADIDTADETAKPQYLQDAANAQLGTLSCTWEGPEGADIASAQELSIVIAPDSATAYAAHAATDLKPAKGGKSFSSTAGDESGYWCKSLGGRGAICYAEMLVRTSWASVTLADYGSNATKATTADVVGSHIAGVLTRVAEQLKAAPQPVPEWVAPAATPPSFCSAGTSTAAVQKAFGIPGYKLNPATKPYIDASSVAKLGRMASCSWSDTKGHASDLDVDLLASGSWVYPGYTTVPYADGIVRKFSPTTITGATSADLGCADGACESSFAVGTTLVNVSFADRGAAKNPVALKALVAAIAAS